MRKLSGVLAKAIGRDEVLRTARAQSILRRWEEIVGPQLGVRSRPDRYDNGTVWISVEGSAWAQELRMLSETILRKLSIMAGDKELFTNLRFGVRPILPAEHWTAPQPYIPDQPHLREMTMHEILERRLKILEDS